MRRNTAEIFQWSCLSVGMLALAAGLFAPLPAQDKQANGPTKTSPPAVSTPATAERILSEIEELKIQLFRARQDIADRDTQLADLTKELSTIRKQRAVDDNNALLQAACKSAGIDKFEDCTFVPKQDTLGKTTFAIQRKPAAAPVVADKK